MNIPTVRISGGDGYLITDDRSLIDVDVVHQFLTHSYWASGISRELVEQSINTSWCFGIYDSEKKQVGYARLVTDYTTFAYLADVFIIESHRGLGLSKWLMNEITSQPAIIGMRRLLLATRTAHSLYEKTGFKLLEHPEWFMEINRPDIYKGVH